MSFLRCRLVAQWFSSSSPFSYSPSGGLMFGWSVAISSRSNILCAFRAKKAWAIAGRDYWRVVAIETTPEWLTAWWHCMQSHRQFYYYYTTTITNNSKGSLIIIHCPHYQGLPSILNAAAAHNWAKIWTKASSMRLKWTHAGVTHFGITKPRAWLSWAQARLAPKLWLHLN